MKKLLIMVVAAGLCMTGCSGGHETTTQVCNMVATVSNSEPPPGTYTETASVAAELSGYAGELRHAASKASNRGLKTAVDKLATDFDNFADAVSYNPEGTQTVSAQIDMDITAVEKYCPNLKGS